MKKHFSIVILLSFAVMVFGDERDDALRALEAMETFVVNVEKVAAQTNVTITDVVALDEEFAALQKILWALEEDPWNAQETRRYNELSDRFEKAWIIVQEKYWLSD